MPVYAVFVEWKLSERPIRSTESALSATESTHVSNMTD
ncbi:hypothetical protein L083_7518 [Actinoplanes sp. N902-109]|nr:hypothetical protein L083_7518 [Actinoplanes sp. N902-109]